MPLQAPASTMPSCPHSFSMKLLNRISGKALRCVSHRKKGAVYYFNILHVIPSPSNKDICSLGSHWPSFTNKLEYHIITMVCQILKHSYLYKRPVNLISCHVSLLGIIYENTPQSNLDTIFLAYLMTLEYREPHYCLIHIEGDTVKGEVIEGRYISRHFLTYNLNKGSSNSVLRTPTGDTVYTRV